MDRLTQEQSAGYDLKALNGQYCNNYCDEQSAATCRDCAIYQAIQKLAHYEDMEEQGKLLILPCKQGDVLYETQFISRKWEIFPFKVNYFEVMKSHGKVRIEIHFEGTEGYALCDDKGNLDEGWYLTEQEAKEALERMKE